MGITLRKLAERMSDAAATAAGLQTVASEVTAVAVKDVQDRMDKGLQVDGVTPQPPLNRPRRSGNSGPPLIDFGRMRKTVQAEVRGTRIIVSATGPGARKHQEERPFVGISPPAAAEIVALLLTGLMRNIKGS